MLKIWTSLFLLIVQQSFAANFTAIVGGLDWQHIDFINEFQTTYREHEWAANNSSNALAVGFSNIVGGVDIQDKDFWSKYQSWLSNNCVSFWDHTFDYTVVSTHPYSVMMTYTGWLTIAGMSSNGFRRATAWTPGVDDWTDLYDGMFSYGFMVEGDIIGPWIFDDLQKGFSTLKWTTRYDDYNPIDPVYNVTNRLFRSGGHAGGNPTCDVARTIHIADWDTASWASANAHCYEAFASATVAPTPYSFVSSRDRGRLFLLNIRPPMPHILKVYPIPTQPHEDRLFFDFDNVGMVKNHLWFWEDLAEATATEQVTSDISVRIPTIDTSPVEFSISCPLAEGITYQTIIERVRWIFDWTFAYEN